MRKQKISDWPRITQLISAWDLFWTQITATVIRKTYVLCHLAEREELAFKELILQQRSKAFTQLKTPEESFPVKESQERAPGGSSYSDEGQAACQLTDREEGKHSRQKKQDKKKSMGAGNSRITESITLETDKRASDD